MKSLFALSLIPLLTITSHAQTEQWGQVYFDNSVPFAFPADRLIRVNGGLLVGTNFIAELFYGTNVANMTRLSNAPPARFRPEGTPFPGTWAGGMRTLVGIPSGTPTVMQVWLWDNDAGATMEEARRNNGPYTILQSSTFNYVPPPPGSPLQAHFIENFRGLSSDCGMPGAMRPSILVQPTNQTVRVGDTVVMSVLATNYCDHQWQFNGTNINVLPGSRFLVLSNVQLSQAGDYRVIINPGYIMGSVASQAARLTVEGPPWGEVDFDNTRTFATTADRLVRFLDGSLCIGTNFVAQLYYGTNDASLIPVPSPPLRFRNVPPSDPLAGTWSGARRTLVGMSPGVTATLQVRLWDSDWGGTYEEARTNTFLFFSQSATFTYRVPPPGSPPQDYYIEGFRGFGGVCAGFLEPPIFLSQPADQVAYVGQTVILSAVTTNTCSFRWQFNGTNLLAGRWGPLRINNVQLHHQGNYRVVAVATDPGRASATSEVARLTVHPAPQLTSPRYDNGAFAFHFSGETGRDAVIETAPDLNPATTWTPLFTNTVPFWFTNSTPADRQRYYRTVIR